MKDSRGSYPAQFRAPWWCLGAHCQTLWPVLFRRLPPINLRRERLELPDGDFIDLDWTENHREQAPLVVILHGLEGSSRSHYASGLLGVIQDRGWRGLVMHFRGCSGEPNRLARAYHSGETGDIDYLMKELHRREAQTAIAIVGYSLGGNVLLNWLGRSGRNANLVAAVAVSVPFTLSETADRINRGFSRIYQRHLLRSLLDRFRRKSGRMALPIKLSSLAEIHTMREFDDCIIAPLHGFKDANDYYRQSSSRQRLHNITVDTLLLQAQDDPFMTEAVIPTEAELSSAVTLELCDHGGHVGFVYGRWPWQARYWLEERIPEFLSSRFQPARNDRQT